MDSIGDEDLDVLSGADLLKKLAAMATRGGGDGEVIESRFVMKGEICDEKLFSVNGVM